MRTGEHEWPEEFQDEDKWVFLTKRQWLIVGIGLFLDFILVSFFLLIGLGFLMPVVIVLACVVLILAIVVAFAVVPPNFYLFGSGLRLEQLALRILLKKRKKNRVIYPKNYDNDYREDRP